VTHNRTPYTSEGSESAIYIFNKPIWFIFNRFHNEEPKCWHFSLLATTGIRWVSLPTVRLSEHVIVLETRLQMTGRLMRSGRRMEPRQLMRTRLIIVYHVTGWMQHFWWSRPTSSRIATTAGAKCWRQCWEPPKMQQGNGAAAGFHELHSLIN
jgi:hypothetical protein